MPLLGLRGYLLLYNVIMVTIKKYIPGVCNIGPAEIRLRRWTGHIGLACTLLLIWSYFVIQTDPIARLLIFFPAAVSAMGYLQARMHFCAQFGLVGVFNVSDVFGKRESVDQRAFRRKDQQKALVIIGLSIAVGSLVALVTYSLPF